MKTARSYGSTATMNSIQIETERRRISPFSGVERSLRDILGNAFIDAMAFAAGEACRGLADERVDFLPAGRGERAGELFRQVGEKVCRGLSGSLSGAATLSFDASTKREQSPLSAFDTFRIGEDGRLYLAAKREHYHASLGHDFPGYRLIEHAKRFGIQTSRTITPGATSPAFSRKSSSGQRTEFLTEIGRGWGMC